MTDLPERITSAHFRAVREYLGLTGAWCAQHFDVAERTIRKWDQGEAPIPYGVTDDLQRLVDQTREFVERQAVELSRYPEEMRIFEIPRTSEDLENMSPQTDLTLDWWRNVGARLVDADPAVRLEWVSFD